MKLEKLTVTNFRCFGDKPTRIGFQEDVTAFIGNNGSGKTAVFAALGRLFGVTQAQRTVTKSDFHVPAERVDVASGTKLAIDCVLGFPGLVAGEEDTAVPEVFSHMAVSGPGEPLKVRIRLEATWTDDTTPGGVIEEDVRWVASLDEDVDMSKGRKLAPLERSFIQLVYVPANRNAFDQVTTLLKGRLWRAARWSSAMSEAAAETAGQLQARFDAEAPSRFIAERLEKRWEQVHRGDTAAKPTLRLVENRLEDMVRQAEFVFLPDATGHGRHLHDLSDGQRSLFHIALTTATLEIERDAFSGPAAEEAFDRGRLRRTYLTLLAIEEPENSLSPFFLSRIMTVAREIGAMDGAQVVVSSHSPSILARVEPEEVRYARLDPDARTSDVRTLSLPEEESEARKFVRLAVRAYPELYFARFVVLAEGESEAIVLPRLAEAMGIALDRSFVPIVPLGGRFVTHFWRLLESLQVPYATLLDLDLGRRHGGSKAIAYVVGELRAAGRSLDKTWEALRGEIDPTDVGEADDAMLLENGYEHAWLKALRRLDVYFSFPIDVDFAMLHAFPDAYTHVPEGKRGPEKDEEAVAERRITTLKKKGNVSLYEEDETYDGAFGWYPYLFMGASKPGAHLSALGLLDDEALRGKGTQGTRRPRGGDSGEAAGMTAVRAEDWRPQGIPGLEDRALEALRETDRCVCVTAGAGAGKTELLAQKAAYLLQTGICPTPGRVLAISFKRDAAATLSARVRLRLPQELSRRFVSLTFDAWTKGLLDQFRRALPAPYAPASDYELSFPNRDILNAQVEKLGLDLNGNQLEKLVAATLLPVEEQGLTMRHEHALNAYWRDQYEGYATPLLTFAMINRLVQFMLRRHDGIRAALRSTYPFVFLDEFQDTTSAQFELVRTAFSPKTTRITTVGDDKQRIMGWAGAMEDGFDTFVKTFGARRVTLLANWRSHEGLVAVQRLVAAHIEPGTEPVEARKARSVDGNACAIWVFEDRKTEVERVASWLAAETGRGDVEPHDVVLLARQYVNMVEEELRPDFEARGLVLRNLARNVGGVAIQDLLSEELTTLLLPLLRASATRRAPDAWSSALERVRALRSSLDGDDDLQHRAMREVESLTVSARRFMSEAVPTVAEAEDLVSLLIDAIGEDLIRQATPAYQRGAGYQRVRGGFVALLQECMSGSCTWGEVLDRFEGKGQVPLMTIHKSKGMEFHTVVFFGLDGKSWRDLASGKREEANSFFVALTRAEQRAFFTCLAERGRRIGWLEDLLGDAVPRIVGGPS